MAQGRKPEHGAAIRNNRTSNSSSESGARVGYDGHRRTKGSKVYVAADTLSHPLAALTAAIQEAAAYFVDEAFVDQGYTGEAPAVAADLAGIRLDVVKLPEAMGIFVLLPRRWVVERRFTWATWFRRLAKVYEPLSGTLAAMHFVVLSTLMLANAASILTGASYSLSPLGVTMPHLQS